MGYREEYLKNIPKRLKDLRKTAGLTQEQFAEAANMSICSVRKYEQSSSIPDLYALCKICDFFHCDMDYLAGKYDAHERSTQEIIDQIGLGESAVEKLSEYTYYKSLEWDNIQQLINEYSFLKYMADNGYAKKEDLTYTLDSTDFYCMRGQNKEYLQLITSIITNGLTEAIMKYIHLPTTANGYFDESRENENKNAILAILKKMQVAKNKEWEDLEKVIGTENRGENRGELLQ